MKNYTVGNSINTNKNANNTLNLNEFNDINSPSANNPVDDFNYRIPASLNNSAKRLEIEFPNEIKGIVILLIK